MEKGVLGTVNDCCYNMEFAYGYDPVEAATWRCNKVEPKGDAALFLNMPDICRRQSARGRHREGDPHKQGGG